MRDRHEEITGLGGRVVVIGTGDVRHARHFIEDEQIPFSVLVDDAAEAAKTARIKRVWFHQLFVPASYAGTLRAWSAGHRIGRPGKRTTQLGATFVIGPGDRLRYEHRDAHPADHAPLDAILATLRA